MNSRNRVRLAALKEKQYGLAAGYATWICSFPCSVPACNRGPNWTVPAHAAKTRGAGGDWKSLVPLCWLHEGEWHTRGTFSFDKHYGMSCKDIAADLVKMWEALREEDGSVPEAVTGSSWEDTSGG